MKILFLTRFQWPRRGGVEKHVEEVRKRLKKKGHTISIISENSIIRNENNRHLEFLKKFKIWFWLWQNRILIKKADIIHAHDISFWYWPFRFLYPNKPFFITFHGWEGKYPLPFKNKLIRKISEKLARGNICVGDYLIKWYATKPDFITYGGVGKRGVKSVTDKKEILFIGRLEKDTGLPIYLQTMKSLKRWKIKFCGEGDLKKEAEKQGQVLGQVKNTMSHIVKSKFIFTSGYLAILEAMINKKLVFAVYDNPLKKDYLKMTPFAKWIIIEKNPQKLARKVKYYFNHLEEAQNLTEKAYRWSKKQTWEKVTNLYLELWKR